MSFWNARVVIEWNVVRFKIFDISRVLLLLLLFTCECVGVSKFNPAYITKGIVSSHFSKKRVFSLRGSRYPKKTLCSFPPTNLSVVDTELDNRTFDCPLACLNALRSTVNRKFHFIKIFLHRLKLQVLKACTNIIYSTVTSNLEIESFNPLNTMKKENLINRDRKRTKSTDEGFSNE